MKLTGVCIVEIDGNSYRTKEGATLNFGGFEREEVLADGQVVGYTEKPVAPMVSATFAHGSDTDVDLLSNVTDSTITFRCDSGVGYMLLEAFATAPPELTGGSGDLAVEYKAKSVTRL